MPDYPLFRDDGPLRWWRFDPESPTFADVPLIRLDPDGHVVAVRGPLPLAAQELSDLLEPGQVHGYVLNEDLKYADTPAVGAEFVDPREAVTFDPLAILAAEPGLPELRDQLRRWLRTLDRAVELGWEVIARPDDTIVIGLPTA